MYKLTEFLTGFRHTSGTFHHRISTITTNLRVSRHCLPLIAAGIFFAITLPETSGYEI